MNALKMYILKGKAPVVCEDEAQWAKWMAQEERVVAKTYVTHSDIDEDDVEVTTVFIGLTAMTNDTGEPLLFETMVFGEDLEESFIKRYSSWDEALKGHRQIAADVKRCLVHA